MKIMKNKNFRIIYPEYFKLSISPSKVTLNELYYKVNEFSVLMEDKINYFHLKEKISKVEKSLNHNFNTIGKYQLLTYKKHLRELKENIDISFVDITKLNLSYLLSSLEQMLVFDSSVKIKRKEIKELFVELEGYDSTKIKTFINTVSNNGTDENIEYQDKIYIILYSLSKLSMFFDDFKNCDFEEFRFNALSAQLNLPDISRRKTDQLLTTFNSLNSDLKELTVCLIENIVKNNPKEIIHGSLYNLIRSIYDQGFAS